MSEFPVVDYGRHPAFAGFAKPSDAALDQLVAEIEQTYSRVRDAHDDTDARTAAFDRDVSPRIEALVAGLQPGLAPESARYLKAAVTTATKRLRTRLEEAGGNRVFTNNAAAVLRAELVELLRSFHQDGFCRFDAGGKLARRVWRATLLERAIMRRKVARHPRRHCNFGLHADSPAAHAVRREIEKMGVLDIASAYMGMPMEVVYVSLEVAHPGQDWYQGCYSEIGLPTAKTAYMHFDADRNLLKAMIYLSDVAAENGPFSYIPGSHLWPRPAFATAVQNGFDHAQGDFAAIDEGGWDYVQGYYRPRFQSSTFRKDMMALPAALRGSTHFGDDLQDNSPVSESLLRQETVFTGRAGTMVLFDGSQGIHRGGLVRQNERWVVQVGMAPRQGGNVAKSTGLKSRMRYLKHLLGNLLRLCGLR